MAFDKNAFASEILSGATVDDNVKAAILAAFDNPVVQRNLEGATLRQSEFSKKMDDLNKKIKANEDYWSNLTSWEREAKGQIEKERQLLKQKLADDGVSLDSPNEGTKDMITREEFKKAAEEMFAYANASSALQASHMKEFGEVLDIQKVIEVATREGGNINQAYNSFVTPRREEVRKIEFEKQLVAAREEGKAEALKNYTLPAGDIPHNPVPHALDRKEGTEYGAMAAVKAWNESRKSGTTPLY